MADIKRLNYFTSQFLQAKDFQDERAYHLGMRRLHNQRLHSWGVVYGLDVKTTGTGNNRKIAVDPGLAIDGNGREIVVDKTIELTFEADTYVTVKVVEERTDEYSGNGIQDFTRWTEKGEIRLLKEPGNDVVTLAKVDKDGKLNTGPSVRRPAGAVMNPSADITAGTLTVTGDAGKNTLDVQVGPRTSAGAVKHPTGLALYVTASSGHDEKGVEFRHSNGDRGRAS